MDIMLYIAAGSGVGLAVGLTGIGGGSMMTPLLLLFGFPANIAIGTDLVYAALTKSGGVLVHHRLGHVDWKLVRALSAGSIPSTIVTIYLLKYMFAGSDHYSLILTTCLGFMLTLTALFLFIKDKLYFFQQRVMTLAVSERYYLTVLMGFLLGILVTLTSVGAGVLGTAVLVVLYPVLRSSRVVGTDLAHAVPLTLAGGIGHIWLGNVDFSLLGSLLVGSLPAICLGARVSQYIPEKFLRLTLALVLFGLGINYMF